MCKYNPYLLFTTLKFIVVWLPFLVLMVTLKETIGKKFHLRILKCTMSY